VAFQTPVVHATPRAVGARVEFLLLLLISAVAAATAAATMVTATGARRCRRGRRRSTRLLRLTRRCRGGRVAAASVRRANQGFHAQCCVALVGLRRRRLAGEGRKAQVGVGSRRGTRWSMLHRLVLMVTAGCDAGAALHRYGRVERNLSITIPVYNSTVRSKKYEMRFAVTVQYGRGSTFDWRSSWNSFDWFDMRFCYQLRLYLKLLMAKQSKLTGRVSII